MELFEAPSLALMYFLMNFVSIWGAPGRQLDTTLYVFETIVTVQILTPALATPLCKNTLKTLLETCLNMQSMHVYAGFGEVRKYCQDLMKRGTGQSVSTSLPFILETWSTKGTAGRAFGEFVLRLNFM